MPKNRITTGLAGNIGKTRTAVTSSFRKVPRPHLKMPDIGHLLKTASKRERKIALLCSAIRSRHVIAFNYHGGYCTVEPFCLGTLISRHDNVSLLCYRTGGISGPPEAVGWKLCRLSEIKNIEVLDEQFTGVRHDYDSRQAGMVTVYCSVLPPAEAAVERPENKYLSHYDSMKRFRTGHTLPDKD